MTRPGRALPQTPRVSVGLGVRNGERFLEQALDSILAQTFEDFELLVSDNASTDRTGEICQDYAARDSRIRTFRHSTDIGAAGNFSRLVGLSSAPYFKWAAHDDLISPRFLERTVQALDRNPSAVLCFSRIGMIETDGTVKRRGYRDLTDRLESENPWERFAELLFTRHGCFPIWGLMRREVLARTPLLANFIGCDRALLAELSLHGRMIELPEDLFLLRDHPERSSRLFSFYLRGPWYDPASAGRRAFPHWRLLAEYWRATRRVPLTSQEGFRCRRVAARWPLVEWNWLRMMMDALVNVHPKGAVWHQKAKSLYRRPRQRGIPPGRRSPGSRKPSRSI